MYVVLSVVLVVRVVFECLLAYKSDCLCVCALDRNVVCVVRIFALLLVWLIVCVFVDLFVCLSACVNCLPVRLLDRV